MEAPGSGTAAPMEPIPETVEAIDEIGPYAGGAGLLESLTESADRVREIAPTCIGISVSTRADPGVTFTLVATDEEAATLDGVQYATDGPCVDAFGQQQGLRTGEQDLLNEPTWQIFGQASAAAGVCSTLTLPVMKAGEVQGTINLFGAANDTFDGRHQELAAVFGAWAPAAVTNADLSFMTRRAAEQAPTLLRDQAVIDAATGRLAAALDLDVETAEQRLFEAADRAGVPPAVLARALIEGNDTDLS